jgi:hypothetical protein
LCLCFICIYNAPPHKINYILCLCFICIYNAPPPFFIKKRCLNRIENCGCAESAELLLSSSTFPVRIPIHSDIGGGRGVGTEQKKMIRIVPCMCHQLTDFPTRFRAGGLSSHDWQFSWLKGTVSRDFLLLVFFMNQFPPSPWVYH